MTITQIKARAKALAEKWSDLQSRFLELQEETKDLLNEVEETKDNIEPYEGKDDLTPQQEERIEKLETIWDMLNDVDYAVDTLESDLNEVYEGIDEVQYEC